MSLWHHRQSAPRTTVALLLALASTNAFAYIDPGTGMLALQGLLAFIGGIVVFVRHPVRTLRHWIQKLFKKRS